jgi:hypothetical protein
MYRCSIPRSTKHAFAGRGKRAGDGASQLSLAHRARWTFIGVKLAGEAVFRSLSLKLEQLIQCGRHSRRRDPKSLSLGPEKIF